MKAVAVLMLFASPGILYAQKKASAGTGNYLVFPITTELQRRGYTDGRWHYVLVNGSAALRTNKTIDAKAIDLESLRSSLLAVRDSVPKQNVSITVTFQRPSPTEEARKLLYCALKGLASDARFPKALVGVHLGDYDAWGDALEAAKQWGLPGKKAVDEAAAGGRLVRVYPVRTALSSFTYGGANCVVDILTPLTKSSAADLSREQKTEIRDAIATLKLATKDRVVFCVSRESGTPVTVSQERLKALRSFAKQLGFNNTTIRSVTAP